ncbi:MAG: M16 family metallopeptidase [Cyclobacteriaceae bacterium]|jgi:zinc protease
MKKLLVLFLVFPLLLSGQTRLVEKVVKRGNEIVIPYEKFVLPNGLTLIVHEDHSDPVVHVDVTYHVGSAREEIGKSGFAHFFEHMMFQGSDHVADEQHFKIVTESGGTLNGSTNRDRTNYYQTVPANQLEKMLWLEADRMGFLLDAVTQRKFEVQRETVKNERGQNYDNRPYGLVQETISKNMYPYGHPYSWMTIGYLEDLNRVDVNDLKNFFLRWYGPNNATITVGGDVKAADVVKLTEKYFGSIPRGPEVKPTVLPAPVVEKDRYVTLVDNYARLPQLAITFASVPTYHKDEAALDCLAEILGQGKNSILYQEIVKKQKALNALVFNISSELAGEFTIRLTPTPGVSLADSKKMIDEAIAAFEKRGVTDEDVTKFKGSIEAQAINGLESVAGKVSQLAQYQTFTGNPNKIAEELKGYSALTKEDVWRVYQQYVKGKGSVIVSVVPKGRETDVAGQPNYEVATSGYQAPDYGYKGLTYSKPKDSFDRSKIPGSGPNPVVNVPKFWKKDMGGIQVIGSENKELPRVTISVYIPGGHLLEAADTSKIGLSRMVSMMLNEDTENYTAEQMQVELQKIGSSVSVNSTTDAMVFSVQSLTKNLDRTLALLEERMLRPKFTQDAFNRLQKQSVEGFKQRKSQPASIASDIYNRLTFGDNIIGLSQAGTESTNRRLTLDDVKKYYASNMTSKGVQVVIVGDVEQNTILPKLEFIKKLPANDISLNGPKDFPSVAKTRIFVVDVPKAAQSEYRVGMSTGLKYDGTGEYFRAGLMNYPLGGAFNSRINLNLREDKGWTYGARSGFSGDKYSGEFSFSSGIRANATDSALSEVMKELSDYAKSGIRADELTFMKQAIGQRDALRYETGFQKAGFIRNILYYGLPEDYTKQQSKILADLTASDVNKLSAKWINPDKLNILVVGDKEKILPGLKKFPYDIIELDVDGNFKAELVKKLETEK